MDKNKRSKLSKQKNYNVNGSLECHRDLYDSDEDIAEIRHCRLENRLFALKRQYYQRLEANLSLFAARRLGLPDDGLEEAARLPNIEIKKKKGLWKKFKDFFKVDTRPKPTPQPPLPPLREDTAIPPRYRKVRKSHVRAVTQMNNQMIAAIMSNSDPDLTFYKQIYDKRQNRMMKKGNANEAPSTSKMAIYKEIFGCTSSSGNISTRYSSDAVSIKSITIHSSVELLHDSYAKATVQSIINDIITGSLNKRQNMEMRTLKEYITEEMDQLLTFVDTKNKPFDENVDQPTTSRSFYEELQDTTYDRKIEIIYKRGITFEQSDDDDSSEEGI